MIQPCIDPIIFNQFIVCPIPYNSSLIKNYNPLRQCGNGDSVSYKYNSPIPR